VSTLEPISVVLKLGFLAVLYLFLLWVVRSSLRDLRRAQGGAEPLVAAEDHVPRPAPDATAMHSAADDMLGDRIGGEPRLVVERAAGHPDGIAYDLTGGAVTLGRGDVEIRLEDPFASGQHARIERQGSVLVLEDLDSTNGTYLNEEPLRGIQPLHHGDRIRIGDSEFSYLQD
jgi:hypothetical protein